MPTTGNQTTDRLKRRSDFLRVQQSGRKWIAPTVIVQVGTSEEAIGPRIGFTATKKLGNAVTRNRVKRRLRMAVREALGQARPAFDIVLVGRAETATCPYANLVKDLRWCLKRLEITGHEKTADTHS